MRLGVVLCCALALIFCGPCISTAFARMTPKVSDFQELFSWVSIEYQWLGHPAMGDAASREEAIRRAIFIPENNIITGVNHYQGTTFVCIPRWRPGVPATLNRVVTDAVTKKPILIPWPSWQANTQLLRNVQSIFIDQARALAYVIDTGRENFLSSNASDIINRNAALIVYDISAGVDKDPKVVYKTTFPDNIFDPTTSFLNDIVVNPDTNVAYMTDTNTAGLGALVMHDLKTGVSVRFQDPNSTFANHSYVIEMNGVKYPQFKAPVDGIALNDDGSRVYYSPIDGAALYCLDALVFADPTSTFEQIRSTVKLIGQKASNSGGLRYMPSPQPGMQDYVLYGSNGENSVNYIDFHERMSHYPIIVNQVVLEHNDFSMQWIDTFAKVPLNETHTDVYFTTNRLPLFLTRTMDWSGKSGGNMRVFKFCWSIYA